MSKKCFCDFCGIEILDDCYEIDIDNGENGLNSSLFSSQSCTICGHIVANVLLNEIKNVSKRNLYRIPKKSKNGCENCNFYNCEGGDSPTDEHCRDICYLDKKNPVMIPYNLSKIGCIHKE